MTGVTARLDPHLADRMCEADFLWRTTFSDLFLACAGLPGRTALPGGTLAEELDLLDKLSDEQFVDGALEFTCALPYDVPGRGPLSDEGCAAARWSWPPREDRGNCCSPSGCWPTRRAPGRGCGSSSRTATRRSSRRRGPGCGTSSRRTPASRRTCCGTRGWARR